MRVPKKMVCELITSPDGSKICDVDQNGWGTCGDGVIDENGELCLWAEKVLEWQDIEPIYLKGARKDKHGAAGF